VAIVTPCDFFLTALKFSGYMHALKGCSLRYYGFLLELLFLFLEPFLIILSSLLENPQLNGESSPLFIMLTN
jgi:hypothetical protein